MSQHDELDRVAMLPLRYELKVIPMAGAIAQAEGYYVRGSLPFRTNNPGDLVDPITGVTHEFHTSDQGWRALLRQVELMFSGQSKYYNPEMTFEEISKIYTGGDQYEAWARTVCDRLRVSPKSKLGEWLKA